MAWTFNLTPTLPGAGWAGKSKKKGEKS